MDSQRIPVKVWYDAEADFLEVLFSSLRSVFDQSTVFQTNITGGEEKTTTFVTGSDPLLV